MSLQNVFCKHYQAMSEHKACKAGVLYSTLDEIAFDKRPCFNKPLTPPRPGCDLVELPTREELEADEAEMNERLAKIDTARQAIVDHLGGPWTKKKPSGGSGVIDCPCCKAEKSLRFSRAGYNGHIHATCTTLDCVSWME